MFAAAAVAITSVAHITMCSPVIFTMTANSHSLYFKSVEGDCKCASLLP